MARSRETDSQVPRAKAWFHALIPAVAFLLGPPFAGYLIGATALVMLISVVGGPKLSLFGQLYRKVIKPAFKLKDGKKEAAAPHRFAELVGAVFLAGSAAVYFSGAVLAGQVLALTVVALAVLNGAAGICVGCQIYMLFKRLQGQPAT